MGLTASDLKKPKSPSKRSRSFKHPRGPHGRAAKSSSSSQRLMSPPPADPRGLVDSLKKELEDALQSEAQAAISKADVETRRRIEDNTAQTVQNFRRRYGLQR
ncbi:MAG: hypothetical protein INR64_19280 [Caulobacteraceae bacterium]|nr:hypothetical protein [Caulobacter sp.]